MLGYKYTAGFTLIELLVVMTISGVLIAFVGPVAMQGIESAKARAEIEKVSNVIRSVSSKSFAKGQITILSLKNQQLSVDKGISLEFEKLKFSEQTISFNRNGYPDKVFVKYQYNKQEVELNLFQVLGFSEEQFVYAP